MIKPYYEENGITIYNADCFNVMRQMVTYSISLIVTDPPYGINADVSQKKGQALKEGNQKQSAKITERLNGTKQQ